MSFAGSCTLTTNDTQVTKTVRNNGKVDDWCLGEAIAKAILAFDAANPSTSSSLRERVMELLYQKEKKK